MAEQKTEGLIPKGGPTPEQELYRDFRKDGFPKDVAREVVKEVSIVAEDALKKKNKNPPTPKP